MTSRAKRSVAGGGADYATGSRLRDREHVRSKRQPMDLPFLMLVVLLLGIGVIMVLSASFASAYYNGGNPTYFFLRQLIFAIAGVFIMLIISRVPVVTFHRFAMLFLLVSIVSLALVPIIGVEENGSKRWLSLGFTTFQPSELAKVAVVLSFASMICTYKNKMKTVKYGILPFAGILVVIVALLLLQPHLSASVIIIAVGIIMMFLGGMQLKWLFGGGAVVGLAGAIVVTQFSHASSRIAAWLDPFAYAQGSGWQIVQSLYAIGSGGLLGLGLGQSRQKYLYLPEEHNDYIFAVVCEELGFIGAMLILALFAVLIVRGYWISLHAKTRFGSLVAAGLTSLLAVQVFLNVAVVTNLVPSTGIALPFFSYGGTALLIQLAEMGIILSISREIPVKKAG